MRPFLLKISLLWVACTFALCSNAQHVIYSLEIADSLFKQYKLIESHNAYLNIANNPEYGATMRVKAYRQFAAQEWKFFRHYDDAVDALRVAKTLKTDLYNIYLLQGSISVEAGKYGEALLTAAESLKLAKSDIEQINAGIVFAKAVNEQGFYGKPGKHPLNKQDQKKALIILNHILEKQPGNPDASEALIGIGILSGDGEAVIKGWKSYYLVNNEQDINQAIKPGFDLLKPILIKWKGTPLTVSELKDMSNGFAGSKFFNYAAYFAEEVRKKNATVIVRSRSLQDIIAYQAYINNVKKVDDDIYPEVAQGLKNYDDKYDSLMDKAGKTLWQKLSGIPKNRKFDPDTLYKILNRKYGTEGYSGTTVNYYGMLMGHIIHKERKQVNQYGYSTNFTYVSVDRLMSRDFTSWYGTTNVGGWGDSTTIIQVRKAYMTEPFEELNWMTDTAEHKRIEALIAQKKQADLEICKKDPYAEPKFLSPYLKFNEASKIYKHLIDSGLRGMQLNIAFIDEILKLTIASTVFAHEGRHAIDQLYFPKEFKAMSDDERELRAKFSEVIYSLDPKMAFTGSILGSDLDENTNHGKANKRFRVIVVDWMKGHQNEITGLDKNVPLLMQFDLLTNQQLIAISKSADPLEKVRGR